MDLRIKNMLDMVEELEYLLSVLVMVVHIIQKEIGMFQIDPLNRTPVYEQLIRQTERFVLTGVFRPLEQVPSVRALSVELGINPNTIQKAYSQMEASGILQSVPGKGRFVTEKAKDIIGKQRREQLDILREKLKEFSVAGITRAEIEECLDSVYGE
jgi:GntR family transcriptional regulator